MGVKIPLNRTQLFLLKPWSKQPKGYHHPYNQGFPTFTLPTVILHLVWLPKVSTSFSFVIPKMECLGRIGGSIKYYGQRGSGKLKNGISFLWAPCCITDLCDIQITGRTMYGVLFWISGRRGLFSRSLSIWNLHEGTTHWPHTLGWKKVPMRISSLQRIVLSLFHVVS